MQHHDSPKGSILQAVAELNKQTGANVDPNSITDDYMQASTRGLMAAVSSLPELTERKRTLDKHTNLATGLMKVSISRRSAFLVIWPCCGDE